MARRQEANNEEKGDSEGWIVTFADLMTLLFCFFVLLTTLSTAPKACGALAQYFEENRAFFKNFELRNSKLECVITLPSDFLFRSGQDSVQQAALTRLKPLFETIKEIPEHKEDLIIVEGHTDNVPIKSRRFPSNWELSSARATNVAGFLRQVGLPEEQLSVRAYAENRPRVPYQDQFGEKLAGKNLLAAQRKNRRVEIILQDPPKELDDYGVLFR